MILVIRIAGDVDLTETIKETLFRMRIRRKYSAVLLHENVFNEKLLQNVKDFVAFGKITKPMLEKLIELRGQPVKKGKIDAGKIALELDKKSLSDLGLKPFFRLHPPRGGIDSKIHYNPKTGKGVLGNNREKINDLLERML